MRVANQVIRGVTRALPKNRGAGDDKAIGTDDPNTLTGEFKGRLAAHGISGKESLMVTLAVGTLGAAVNITVWAWFDIMQSWVKLGANSTANTKEFSEFSIDGIAVPESTPFYFQGDAEVEDAWVDHEDIKR